MELSIDLSSIPSSSSGGSCSNAKRALLMAEFQQHYPATVHMPASPADLEYPAALAAFRALERSEEHSLIFGFTTTYMKSLEALVASYETDVGYLGELLRYNVGERVPALRRAVKDEEAHLAAAARRKLDVERALVRQQGRKVEARRQVSEYLGPSAAAALGGLDGLYDGNDDGRGASASGGRSSRPGITFDALERVFVAGCNTGTGTGTGTGADRCAVATALLEAVAALVQEMEQHALAPALETWVQWHAASAITTTTASAAVAYATADNAGDAEKGNNLCPSQATLAAWHAAMLSTPSPTPSPRQEGSLRELLVEAGALEGYWRARGDSAGAAAALGVVQAATDPHLMRLSALVARGSQGQGLGLDVDCAETAVLQLLVRAVAGADVAEARLQALSRDGAAALEKDEAEVQSLKETLLQVCSETATCKAALERAILTGMRTQTTLPTDELPAAVRIAHPALHDIIGVASCL